MRGGKSLDDGVGHGKDVLKAENKAGPTKPILARFASSMKMKFNEHQIKS